MDSKRRECFIAFLSACNENSVCDVILKERLDYETTGDARIIPNKKVAQSKFVKLKTRLYYKQQKFNLLREESEGYAKLITELNQVDDFDVSSMNQVIRSLIGCFNLDPNRVLDVMLESFESRLHLEKSYVPLISKFLDNETTLTQVLALKFSFYQVGWNNLFHLLSFFLLCRSFSHSRSQLVYNLSLIGCFLLQLVLFQILLLHQIEFTMNETTSQTLPK